MARLKNTLVFLSRPYKGSSSLTYLAARQHALPFKPVTPVIHRSCSIKSKFYKCSLESKCTDLDALKTKRLDLESYAISRTPITQYPPLFQEGKIHTTTYQLSFGSTI